MPEHLSAQFTSCRPNITPLNAAFGALEKERILAFNGRRSQNQHALLGIVGVLY